MVKLLVVADDFTGALDTGVQFAKRDIPTLVSTNTDFDIDKLEDGIEVLVIDTESRHIPEEEAAARVGRIVRRALLSGTKYFYKKTDSTLRGNIGSELSALIEVHGSNELMFIPAFPKMGRKTVEGIQYVNGVPLHETQYAKDPLEPIRDSFIPDILKSQTHADIVIVKGQRIDGDLIRDKKTIFVFDAENDEHLVKIGCFLKSVGKLGVTAGCAGFAGVLPELLGLERRKPVERGLQTAMLVICGSINEVSIKQVQHAENLGYSSITLSPEQLLDNGYLEKETGRRFLREITSHTLKNKPLIIKTAGSRDEIIKYTDYGEKLGLHGRMLHARIAQNLGRLVKGIEDNSGFGNMVIFGGDTAVGIMNAIGCHGIQACDEIIGGVAFSKVVSEKYKLNIITKAGGFGSENVLEDIRRYLERGA